MMSPVPHGEDRDKPPDNPDDGQLNHLDPPDVVINADSSDSEDEAGGGYMGYQMLAQDVQENDSSDSEQNEEDTEEMASGHVQSDNNLGIDVNAGLVHHVTHPDFPNAPNLPGYMKVPDMPRPERGDLLWNQPRHQKLLMDSDHADQIRSAMSGFQLPASHIPDWAKSISDDQWKEQVVNRLVQKNCCDSQVEKRDEPTDIQKQEVITVDQIQNEAGTSAANTNSSVESVTTLESVSDVEASKT